MPLKARNRQLSDCDLCSITGTIQEQQGGVNRLSVGEPQLNVDAPAPDEVQWQPTASPKKLIFETGAAAHAFLLPR